MKYYTESIVELYDRECTFSLESKKRELFLQERKNDLWWLQ